VAVAPSAGRPAAPVPAAGAPGAPTAASATRPKADEPKKTQEEDAPAMPKVVVPDVAMRGEVNPSDARLSQGALSEVTEPNADGLDAVRRGSDAPALDATSRSQINAALGRFARALEAQDITALRRAYPGLTPSERDTWIEFFRSADAVDANFTARDVEVMNGHVEVTAVGKLKFFKRDTREQLTSAVSMNVQMVRTTDGWKMQSMR
jgi:hypothetical protein